MKRHEPTKFEQAASARTNRSFFAEFWSFLKSNKKWWLLPVIIVFLILATLIFLSSTGLAPFIYTLF